MCNVYPVVIPVTNLVLLGLVWTCGHREKDLDKHHRAG